MSQENRIEGNFIRYKSGLFFPLIFLALGYLGIIYGFIYLFRSNPYGLILIAIGLFLSFSRSGTEIEFENKKYRKYLSFFTFKLGKWKSIQEYPYITVLRSIESTRQHWHMRMPKLKERREFFDITLLSSSHIKKFAIKRFNNVEEAREEIETFADLLGIEITMYNPKTSRRW
jgi:hypothetical protein